MSWITEGAVVAFNASSNGITGHRAYRIYVDTAGFPFFLDDDGFERRTPVGSWDAFVAHFGYKVSGEYSPGKGDPRTALIEALKARFESLKDAPLTSEDEVSERRWAAAMLQYLYKIEAEIVPGPVTVRFTELANTH